MIRVLSLGAGVQSSALLLMALDGFFGEAPEAKPTAAIFADTGWEPKAVYEHLDRLEAAVAPFPVIRVSAGNIREDALSTSKRSASMPLYIKDKTGNKGQLKRQCTNEYKVAPIRKEIRRRIGHPKGTPPAESCELWLGISLDEATRMKPSPVKFVTHRWPLIESRLTREDCARYLKEQGFSDVPKSACIGCPYRDNARWFDLRDNHPEDFSDAVEFDRSIRTLRDKVGSAYLHRRAIPLEDLRTEEEMGQMAFDLFDAECEGMCGL